MPILWGPRGARLLPEAVERNTESRLQGAHSRKRAPNVPGRWLSRGHVSGHRGREDGTSPRKGDLPQRAQERHFCCLCLLSMAIVPVRSSYLGESVASTGPASRLAIGDAKFSGRVYACTSPAGFRHTYALRGKVSGEQAGISWMTLLKRLVIRNSLIVSA